MKLGNYNFTEPAQITSIATIPLGAVYAVLTHNQSQWYLLYLGQSKNIADRFDSHEKWSDWVSNQMTGGLYFSCLPVSNMKQRLDIETELRNQYKTPCNDQ